MIPNRSIILLLILFALGSTVTWTNKFDCGEFLQHFVLLSTSANKFYVERGIGNEEGALSLFADRFYPSLTREGTKDLFPLVAIWISSKIHESPSLSVKSFKSLADNTIKEQHFTTKDFLEAKLVLIHVLKFEIGMLSIPFHFFEDLLTKFSDYQTCITDFSN
ncbi:hypothetical protein R3W88_012049 [Solanum pinnatisectum]|uniref:Uncharacterized protein n=1 Tax=Solanum pinnatisectum TaxID=50273 RepID=A0AAV9L8A4_9SOLN|nr:hypothetical protein R3W88_012049 [Solanum pinnatisectum]